MNSTINSLLEFLLIAAWVAGVVLSNGFWSALTACYFPPWAWYLVIKKLMEMNGII